MKYRLIQTGEFKSDLKRVKKRHCDLDILKAVVEMLAEGKDLDPKYR